MKEPGRSLRRFLQPARSLQPDRQQLLVQPGQLRLIGKIGKIGSNVFIPNPLRKCDQGSGNFGPVRKHDLQDFGNQPLLQHLRIASQPGMRRQQAFFQRNARLQQAIQHRPELPLHPGNFGRMIQLELDRQGFGNWLGRRSRRLGQFSKCQPGRAKRFGTGDESVKHGFILLQAKKPAIDWPLLISTAAGQFVDRDTFHELESSKSSSR